MHSVYGRDLDLNLLRVFVVVAEAGSVTEAASRLYLTQPAVSAALRRLATAVGAPLFARSGRGLALTARGQRLLSLSKPHLSALVDAALSSGEFDPRTADRTVRLGLADTSEGWLLPALLRSFGASAPLLRLIVLPVQFRTVGEMLTTGRVDLAVTVADDLQAEIARRPLYTGGFVCLFDPRHASIGKKPTLSRYLAHDHIVVSYNGDLRGVVEDALGIHRRVRVSVPTFHTIGRILDGSALIATIPELVARHILADRPHLRTAPLPFSIATGTMELLWRRASNDDPLLSFVRAAIVRAAEAEVAAAGKGRSRG